MTAIAVAVINHNGGTDILECLRSLPEAAEVVVVDNASTDDSVAALEREPGVRLIRNPSNRGFAAAANQAIAASSSPYVFLVNPDAWADPGALPALSARLDALPRVAVIGPAVANPDGSPQPTKRAFPGLWHAFLHAIVGPFWPNNPGTRAYVLADAAFDRGRTVDWVAGTAMALRREAFDAVGGFDERFFFFVEDVDLCRRFWDAGWEVWFDPAARLTHRWGGSWTRRPLRFIAIHHVNLFRYVRKHRRGAWVVFQPVIAAGLAVRFGLVALRWLILRRSVPAHRRTGRMT